MLKKIKYIFGIAILLFVGFLSYVYFFNQTPRHTSSGYVLRDARAVASGLNSYFLEKKTYPTSLNQIDLGAQSYLGRSYDNPTKCPPGPAIYNYQKKSDQEYQFTFCLEEETMGYSAGIHVYNENGIKQ